MAKDGRKFRTQWIYGPANQRIEVEIRIDHRDHFFIESSWGVRFEDPTIPGCVAAFTEAWKQQIHIVRERVIAIEADCDMLFDECAQEKGSAGKVQLKFWVADRQSIAGAKRCAYYHPGTDEHMRENLGHLPQIPWTQAAEDQLRTAVRQLQAIGSALENLVKDKNLPQLLASGARLLGSGEPK
jgi:hypothetical protein